MSEVAWPWRAVDPSDREVCRVLGVPPETLAEFRRPQGIWRRSLSDEFDLFACWWTDALGRRHWYANPIRRTDMPAVDGHPLTWIAPPGSVVCRERGKVRDWLTVCRCGVAGTPEQVAWMGSCCGPCHDREEEGLPPLGLSESVRAASRVHPLRKGGLLAFKETDSLDQAEEAIVGLESFDSPFASTPQWRIRMAKNVELFNFGENCLVRQKEELQWLALDTGELRPASLTEEPVRGVQTCEGRLWIATPGHLLVYEETGSAEPRLRTRLRREDPHHVDLYPAPGGQRVLIKSRNRMEVLDILRDQVVMFYSTERITDHGGGRITYDSTYVLWPSFCGWLPSGDLVGGSDAQGSDTFVRWRGLAKRKPRSDLPRPRGISKPEEILCRGCRGSLVLDPDDRLLRWQEGHICIHDPATLQIVRRISISMIDKLDWIAFSPQGDLYARGSRGLMLYPWQEMTR